MPHLSAPRDRVIPRVRASSSADRGIRSCSWARACENPNSHSSDKSRSPFQLQFYSAFQLDHDEAASADSLWRGSLRHNRGSDHLFTSSAVLGASRSTSRLLAYVALGGPFRASTFSYAVVLAFGLRLDRTAPKTQLGQQRFIAAVALPPALPIAEFVAQPFLPHPEPPRHPSASNHLSRCIRQRGAAGGKATCAGSSVPKSTMPPSPTPT
jgi:hypothetical protein